MVIRKGSTRFAFLFGRWVIKVPRWTEWRLFLRGLLANLQERQWSRTGDDRIARVYVADPIGLMLVMERAQSLPKTFRQRHLDASLAQGRFDGLPQDFHIGNFGFRGRTLIMIDYGS